MIILSKTVRRECRGAMYGVVSAFGSLGAYIGVTLGKYVHGRTTQDSIYLGEMVIVFLIILLLIISELYKDNEF